MVKLFYFLIIILFHSIFVFATEINVIDVKRNITLSNDDVVYKDFYLNAGDGSALRKNLVVTVKRKITVRESATKNIGDFDTTIGLLKIIHVGNKVSVAREFKLTSRDEEPVVEQVGIISGDRIDLAGSFIDYSKPNYKKSSAEAELSSDKNQTVKSTSASEAGVIESSSNAGKTELNPTPIPSAPLAPSKPTAPEKVPKQNTEALITTSADIRSPALDIKNEPSLFEKILPLPNSR
jgi:hypothetical protein